MGKLIEHQPHIKHFTHPHLLELINLSIQPQSSLSCSGCNLQLSGYLYTCRPCNFTLHQSCTQYPQLITHPSHPYPNHTLTLIPTPLYPGSSFQCDACKRTGSAFSYHCSICDFDLHPNCASKPMSLTHPFHPSSHPLTLTFTPPYAATKGFSCDVCRRIGGQAGEWLYRCVPCKFDAHFDCATAKPPPPLQHYHSLPTTPITHQNQFPQQQQPQHNYMHSASTGGRFQGNYPAVAAAPANNGPGNDLGNAVMTGFVEGAAQQLGQSFMQSIMGGGSSGGGDSGGVGGGDSSGDSYSFQSSSYDD